MAGATRLELATSGVTGRRSNQTELRPRIFNCFFLNHPQDALPAVYPATTYLKWWAEQGLNL